MKSTSRGVRCGSGFTESRISLRGRTPASGSLEEIEAAPGPGNIERDVEERLALERLLQLILRLKPIDRQLMLLYLEDLYAAEIGEITGVSPANVRKTIHRIKCILARQFHEGEAP